MTTGLHETKLTGFDPAKWDNHDAPNDFSHRVHAAAALIPNGPPLGQWVFKLVVSELRGHGVTGVEAVRRATKAVRETDPDFEPRYDSQLLEQ